MSVSPLVFHLFGLCLFNRPLYYVSELFPTDAFFHLLFILYVSDIFFEGWVVFTSSFVMGWESPCVGWGCLGGFIFINFLLCIILLNFFCGHMCVYLCMILHALGIFLAYCHKECSLFECKLLWSHMTLSPTFAPSKWLCGMPCVWMTSLKCTEIVCFCFSFPGNSFPNTVHVFSYSFPNCRIKVAIGEESCLLFKLCRAAIHTLHLKLTCGFWYGCLWGHTFSHLVLFVCLKRPFEAHLSSLTLSLPYALSLSISCYL